MSKKDEGDYICVSTTHKNVEGGSQVSALRVLNSP